MSYFKSFPYANYTFPDNVTRAYKNLSLRPDIIQEIKNGTSIDFYDVKDGDTPETIAYDVYGDENLNWIIMLANDVFNLYTDWPKDSRLFEQELYDKYRVQKDSDGIERTLTDIQVMEYVQFIGLPENGYKSYMELHDSDNTPKILMRPHHFKDADDNYYSSDTYENTTDAFGRTVVKPELVPVSIETWENDLNEQKKRIVVPSTDVASKLKRELREIMNG